ncbi:hypothetical protein AGMMS50249_8000 [candidate division SR1 bacterium]|nr:hypothetical protein AGMMS50249_8000 [candidate division SR1 bacterium]
MRYKVIYILSFFFSITVFTFAGSDDLAVQTKYSQLLPVVNILLQIPKYATPAEMMIYSCSRTSKNPVIQQACVLIIQDWDSKSLNDQQTLTNTPTSVINQTSISFPLVKVVDGDTIQIQKDGKTISVRLIGLDAPESTTLRYGYVECYGQESKFHLSSLIGNSKTVQLEFDQTQGEIDKYDRLLAYLRLDGVNLNQQMLQDGYAREYTYIQPYIYHSAFLAAENSAIEKEIGLRSMQTCHGDRISSSSSNQTSRIYITGPKGGCYYLNSDSSKVYVDHDFCK